MRAWVEDLGPGTWCVHYFHKEREVSETEFIRVAADLFNRHAAPFNPDGAITKHWLASARKGDYLGAPEGPEQPTENGVFTFQTFGGRVVTYEKGTGEVTEGFPF